VQENIFPIKDTLLQQSDKEKLKGHKGIVLWMFGLSGSGKSTIARALEKDLYSRGVQTKLLDGDNLRSGLNNNLQFSLEDRIENIRRSAEVSKLFMENGDVVICSLVSPTEEIRKQAKKIIGNGFREVYINAPFEVCAERDVKGLYKKALAGKIKNFTGLDSPFEGAENPFHELRTHEKDLDACKNELVELVLKEIQL
jgi:adenylylsulfate kinase